MGELARAEPVPLPRMLLDHLADSLRATYEPKLTAVIEQVRATRPDPGSPEELAAIAAFTRIMLDMTAALGPRASEVLDADVAGQIDALMLKGYEQVESTMKLAYHHLVKSSEVFGRLHRILLAEGETAQALMDDAVAAAKRADADVVGESLEHDETARAMNTMLLYVSVALEAHADKPEELPLWSKRAVEWSRHLDALLPTVAHRLEGLVSRRRAHRAWTGWSDAEIDSELAEWKRLIE